MKKVDITKIRNENADEICSRIREESIEEERALLGKASKEKERILTEAAGEAKAQTGAINLAADEAMARIREKMSSIITIEKNRVSLEGKSQFVADVIAAVKREAENFRADKDYVKFLKEAILEGARIVDDEKAQVFYSYLDENAIGSLKDLAFEFKKSDFKDIGVMVQSRDGRRLLDNRFLTRLKRAYDDIYLKLTKKDF